MVAAIVLAAGRSARYGSNKLLLPLEGEPIVRATVRIVLGSRVNEVVVVLGRDAREVSGALAGLGVREVVNPDFASGMSSSLRAGVRSLPPGAGAAVIVLADQPTLRSDAIDAIIQSWRSSGSSIVAPRFNGERGHPVLFDRRMFGELLAVSGDRGARDLIASDPARVELVELTSSPPLDVDTPEDYRRLLENLERGRGGGVRGV